MEEIYGSLKGNRLLLSTSDRQFIMEGILKDVDAGEERSIFLFNDILINTSRKKALFKNNFVYNFQYSVNLSEVEVIDINDSNTKNTFQLKTADKVNTLCCNSNEEKQVWLKSLHEAINSISIKVQLNKLIGKEDAN